jgi:hypothetical protein
MKCLLATKSVRVLDCSQDTAKFPQNFQRKLCCVMQKGENFWFRGLLTTASLQRVGNGGIPPCIPKLCSLHWGV